MSSLVQALLSNPGIPMQARQQALDRASSDPGLPAPNPTSSFWLSSPHPDLAKRQSPTLPAEADAVTIGSGVTGTSIARTLLESRKSRGGPGQEHAALTLVVDSYRDITGDAFTGVAFLRNSICIGIPFAISPWLQRSGAQNMFISCGFISLAVTLTIIPMILYGKKMRMVTAGRYRVMAAKQG
ncbi:hypothetical protein BDV10DRAFT_189364 [Aspergillus recurvatus]